MDLSRFVLGMLFALPAVAQADIYACTGRAPMTVYQNFPCENDSSGASGPNKTTQASATAPTASTARGVGAGRIPGAQSPTNAGDVRKGMSESEVRAIWGEPMSIYSDELVDGRIDIWTYDGSRAVHFDPQGHAVTVERRVGGAR